jgi:carbon storage regulator CsrA
MGMLVLTRRVHESITITCLDGKQIVLRVVEIDGGKVRLGFEADKRIEILRDNARNGG